MAASVCFPSAKPRRLNSPTLDPHLVAPASPAPWRGLMEISSSRHVCIPDVAPCQARSHTESLGHFFLSFLYYFLAAERKNRPLTVKTLPCSIAAERLVWSVSSLLLGLRSVTRYSHTCAQLFSFTLSFYFCKLNGHETMPDFSHGPLKM